MTDTKTLDGQKERNYERSEFGKCLQDLMYSRNVFTARDLSELSGGEITDRLVRQLWSQRSRPSHRAMESIAKALKLTARERSRLAASVYFEDEWRAV